MLPVDVAVEHYASQQRQAEATAILVRRLWRQVSLEDLDGSWAAVSTRLRLVVAAAQLGAAKAGAAYVPLALAVGGAHVAAAGAVNAARWAGVASDGRPLDSLLFSAVVHTREQLGARGGPAANAAGGKRLDMLVRTQVADAGRGATGVAVAARPRVEYERFVSPPCCQRCAVLAGKRFKWNQGFLRHPRCDCKHLIIGADKQSGYRTDIGADQVKDLTAAQRKAVGDGADLNQVINAHRKGARSGDGMTTSEGTTRRSVAGQRGGRQRRLTPEGVYRVSSTREEAVRRLIDNGYLLL